MTTYFKETKTIPMFLLNPESIPYDYCIYLTIF